MIVAIEGIDASGKATQSKLLADKLSAKLISFPNYTTPSGIMIGKMLREQMWVSPSMHDAQVLQALMTVNRYEMWGVIDSLRKLGKSIVFDRYYASSIVYGKYDGVSEDWIKLISDGLPQPDHHVLIDVSVEEAAKRRPEARDKYERDRSAMMQRRELYLKLFNRMRRLNYKGEDPKLAPWHVVDGHGTISEVQARICAAVGV